MLYAIISCRISAFSKEMANSPQPVASKWKTLSNQKHLGGLPPRYVSKRIATTDSTFSMLL